MKMKITGTYSDWDSVLHLQTLNLFILQGGEIDFYYSQFPTVN